MKVVLPILDKNYILDRIDQEDIFARYFGISRIDIDKCIATNGLIANPNRNDKNPSMGFRYSGNKLKCRDFSGYFWGDCFDAVARVIHLSPQDPQDFKKILVDIAKEFKIHRYTLDNRPTIEKRTEIIYKPTREFRIISVAIRAWNLLDAEYWLKAGIQKKTLKKFHVFPVSALWINDLFIYEYSKDDPAYAYYFGKDKQDRELWKIYFPLRPKGHKYGRFLSNCFIVQGGRLMTNADYCVINKSYKDVMCLDRWADKYSFTGIAPNSEGQILTYAEMNYIYSKVKKVITLTDFDRAGILFGLRMQKQYNTIPLFFTNGYYNTFDFEAKDLAEYYNNFGFEKTDGLIAYYYEVINNPDLLNSPDYMQYIHTKFNHNFGHNFSNKQIPY